MDGLTTDKEKQEMVKLEVRKEDWYYRTPEKENYVSVCIDTVKELFKIPKRGKITFCLNEKASQQSYKCEWDGLALYVTLTNGRRERYITTHPFDQYFSRHFPQLLNKPFYVSVYY